MDIWIAHELDLYKWIDGQPHYIPITVKAIVWDGKDDLCQNAADPTDLGFTNVTFMGTFPEAAGHIFNLPRDTTFDAVRILTGTRADNYDNHYGGLRFIIREIVDKTLPCFMARTPDEDGVVFLFTKARCKVELLPEKKTTEE